MDKINRIVIHCSATKPRKGRDNSPLIGVKEIRRWHVEERGWRDIGYHYVIKRDGTIQQGRPDNVQGAHAAGYNKDSLGICLVGGMEKGTNKAVANYTDVQWEMLRILVEGLTAKYQGAAVCGHNQLTKTKTCPNFDVPKWWVGVA